MPLGVRTMRGLCLNWKVIGGLGVVALGVVVVLPQLALAVLPVLVIAACPLSCLFMMRGMGRGSSCQTSTGSTTAGQMPGAALNDGERIAQLQAEIRRLRAEQADVTPEMDGSEQTDRLPVA